MLSHDLILVGNVGWFDQWHWSHMIFFGVIKNFFGGGK